MIGVFGYIWLGSFVVAGVILLAGSIVPTNRNRGLSDWAMLGGMVLTFLSLVGLALLVFVFEPSYPPFGGGYGYEFWQRLVMAVAFGTSGGLIIFSAGFLLSRFEARRQRIQEDLLRPALPGSVVR